MRCTINSNEGLFVSYFQAFRGFLCWGSVLGLWAGSALVAGAQSFTFQVGTPPQPPTPLVQYTNIWSYHKGTNAPQANWQTISDGALDATWATGRGGFGYGDAAITNENTPLPDMLNRYTTLFVRKTFTVSNTLDTNQHLRIGVDY